MRFGPAGSMIARRACPYYGERYRRRSVPTRRVAIRSTAARGDPFARGGDDGGDVEGAVDGGYPEGDAGAPRRPAGLEAGPEVEDEEPE